MQDQYSVGMTLITIDCRKNIAVTVVDSLREQALRQEMWSNLFGHQTPSINIFDWLIPGNYEDRILQKLLD